MKKVCCLLLALLLCLSVSIAAFAAEPFVPSIGYKGGPEIVDAKLEEEEVTDCLVVTSIKEAQEKTTDIAQSERDLLLDVYSQLSKGTMELPVGDVSYVIRELVDVSFTAIGCQRSHDHAAWLAEEGNTATIKFDMGIDKDVVVTVLAYVDGEWIFAESVTNNGDGTLTVELEDICPVAFVLADGPVTPPVEDDGTSVWVWIVILLVLVAALIFFLIFWKRRKNQNEEEQK